MKKISFIFLCCIISIISLAQYLPGYISGNYSGVNGVVANPANVAANRYKWNVNIFSVQAGIANNNASFNLSNITSTFDNDADSLLFGDGSGKANGMLNMDILGPSFLLEINKKSSIAFTSRIRVMANIADLDGEFINSIDNDLSPSSLPITLQSNENQKIIINGWTDWGITYGRVLFDKGSHFIKAGITAKYLAGATNNYANIDNLNGTLDDDILGDVYMTNATGRVAIGVAGIDFSDDDIDFTDAVKFKSSGIGADLGFIYEYRPAEASSYPGKYKFRAGLAILDIGSVKYKPDPNQSGDYTINISSSQQWYPRDLEDKSLSEIKTYLDGSPYFTNNGGSTGSYKVSLPATMQLNVDYAFNSMFYLNAAGLINLVKQSSVSSSFYYNSFVLTPRFEKRIFSAFLPLSYNTLSGFNVGLSFRIGPFFIGSGSVINALIDNSKQADFHMGFQFGGLLKN